MLPLQAREESGDRLLQSLISKGWFWSKTFPSRCFFKVLGKGKTPRLAQHQSAWISSAYMARAALPMLHLYSCSAPCVSYCSYSLSPPAHTTCLHRLVARGYYSKSNSWSQTHSHLCFKSRAAVHELFAASWCMCPVLAAPCAGKAKGPVRSVKIFLTEAERKLLTVRHSASPKVGKESVT